MSVIVMLASGQGCADYKECESCREIPHDGTTCSWVVDANGGSCQSDDDIQMQASNFPSADLRCIVSYPDNKCYLNVLDTVRCGWEHTKDDYEMIALALVENAQHITVENSRSVHHGKKNHRGRHIIHENGAANVGGAHNRSPIQVLSELYNFFGLEMGNLLDNLESPESVGKSTNALKSIIPNLDEKVQAVLRAMQPQILQMTERQLCPDQGICKSRIGKEGINVVMDKSNPGYADIIYHRIIEDSQEVKSQHPVSLAWHATMKLEVASGTVTAVSFHNEYVTIELKDTVSTPQFRGLHKFIYPYSEISKGGCVFDKASGILEGPVHKFVCGESTDTFNSEQTFSKFLAPFKRF